MSVKAIPGRPIRKGAVTTALVALGFDPETVKGAELGTHGVEIAWGDSTYSSHPVSDDPWMPDEESTRFLVVDLERLDPKHRDNLRQLVKWYLDRHGEPEQAPF